VYSCWQAWIEPICKFSKISRRDYIKSCGLKGAIPGGRKI
jgi:hypothetical protein